MLNWGASRRLRPSGTPVWRSVKRKTKSKNRFAHSYGLQVVKLAAAPQEALRYAPQFVKVPLPMNRFANYTGVYEIGRGAYATVYSAFKPKNYSYIALKESNNNALAKKALKTEHDLLERLQSPFILSCGEIFEDDQSLVMEMEKASLSLAEYLTRPLEESQVQSIAKMMLLALQELHNQRIIHKDIKPSNILLFEDPNGTNNFLYRAKLSDFGVSKQYQQTIFSTHIAGTEGYMAPEMQFPEIYAGYNQAVDIFSLGVVLYRAVNNKLPYDVAIPGSFQRFCNDFKIDPFQIPFEVECSENLKHLICCMLTIEPQERISVADALRHVSLVDTNINLNKINGRNKNFFLKDVDFQATDSTGVASMLLNLITLMQTKKPGLYDLRPDMVFFNQDTKISTLVIPKAVKVQDYFYQNDFLSMQPIEVVFKKPCDAALDMSWTIACLGMFLMTGRLPFYDEDTEIMQNNIKKRRFNAQPNKNRFSKRLISIITGQFTNRTKLPEFKLQLEGFLLPPDPHPEETSSWFKRHWKKVTFGATAATAAVGGTVGVFVAAKSVQIVPLALALLL